LTRFATKYSNHLLSSVVPLPHESEGIKSLYDAGTAPFYENGQGIEYGGTAYPGKNSGLKGSSDQAS
jgi:hypothetical protein